MSEKAGSIYVEVSARLDDFKKGIDTATARLNKFEKDANRTRDALAKSSGSTAQDSGLTLNNLTRSVAKLGGMLVALKTVSNVFKALHENQQNLNSGFDGFVEKLANVTKAIPIIGDAWSAGEAIGNFLFFDSSQDDARKKAQADQRNNEKRNREVNASRDIMSSMRYDSMYSDGEKVEMDRKSALDDFKNKKSQVILGRKRGRPQDLPEHENYGKAGEERRLAQIGHDKETVKIKQDLLTLETKINEQYDERKRKLIETLKIADAEREFKDATESYDNIKLRGVSVGMSMLERASEGSNARSTYGFSENMDDRKVHQIELQSQKEILEIERERAINVAKGMTHQNGMTDLMKMRLNLIKEEAKVEKDLIHIRTKNRREDVGFGLDMQIREQRMSNSGDTQGLQMEKLQNSFAKQLRSFGDLDMNNKNGEKLRDLFSLKAQNILGNTKNGVANGSVQSAIGSFNFGQDVGERSAKSTEDLLASFREFMDKMFQNGVPVELRALSQ